MKNEIKILHVDDEPHIGHLIKSGLKKKYIVESVCSAREALKKINEKHEDNKYDIYILDIMMPGINGYELCQAIRKTDKITPIIMLSQKNRTNDKLHAIDVGADDYITKPFDMIQLDKRIKLNLKESKYTRSKKEQKEIKIEVEPKKEKLPLLTVYKQNGKLCATRPQEKTSDFELYGFLKTYCKILEEDLLEGFEYFNDEED